MELQRVGCEQTDGNKVLLKDCRGWRDGWNAYSSSCFFQLKCCGFTNYSDFVGSRFEKENEGLLPPSCCWTHSAPCRPGKAEQGKVEVRRKRTPGPSVRI